MPQEPTFIGKVLAGPELYSPQWAEAHDIGCACICKAMPSHRVPFMGKNVILSNFGMFDMHMEEYKELVDDESKLKGFVGHVIEGFEGIDTLINSAKSWADGKSNLVFLCKKGHHRSATVLAAFIAWSSPGARTSTIMLANFRS